MKPVSGMIYTYFFICTRKMWYYSKGISLESGNVNVEIGKLIDESSYSSEKKHILIDDCASIDFMKDNTIFEIKKSKKEKDAAINQIKYYLYILFKKGLNEIKGELRVPKENYIESVTINDEDIKQIEENLLSINDILSKEMPPPAIEKSICKQCAYFELCYI